MLHNLKMRLTPQDEHDTDMDYDLVMLIDGDLFRKYQRRSELIRKIREVDESAVAIVFNESFDNMRVHYTNADEDLVLLPGTVHIRARIEGESVGWEVDVPDESQTLYTDMLPMEVFREFSEREPVQLNV